MKQQPFLSIIVLCYNVKPYIDRCLRSISRQTFSDLEVIVVDDGSTDGGGETLDLWQEKDPRIRVFHKENENIVAARKYGLSKAGGLYVGTVDGDDWIDEQMAEILCGAAKQHDADIVQCSMYRNARTYLHATPHPQEEGLYQGEKYKSYLMRKSGKRDLSHLVQNSLCSKIVRRELLEEAMEGMDDRCVLGEDAICSLLCAARAKRFYQVKKCLYHYRVREGSRTLSYDSDMPEKLCVLSAYGKEEMKKIAPELSFLVDQRVRNFLLMTYLQERRLSGFDEKRKDYWKKVLRRSELQAALSAPLVKGERDPLSRYIYGSMRRGHLPSERMLMMLRIFSERAGRG